MLHFPLASFFHLQFQLCFLHTLQMYTQFSFPCSYSSSTLCTYAYLYLSYIPPLPPSPLSIPSLHPLPPSPPSMHLPPLPPMHTHPAGEEWTKLPPVTPTHIVTARRIRKFFTGCLEANVRPQLYCSVHVYMRLWHNCCMKLCLV